MVFSHRRLLRVIMMLAALFGSLSCERGREKETSHLSGTAVKATLRLKWIYDPGFAGEMVAAKAGFFSRSGLDIELKPGGFEADPIKLVASGSDTFGVAGADSFLLAREKGVPIVAFAAGYLQTPVVFYVRANSGIRSPRDFVGKRVGYQAGQDTATVYEALLKQLGVDRKRIKEVPVKYDFTPFLTGKVDVWPGYAATQSYILQREKIAYDVIAPDEYGLTYLGTVYFTSERFLAEHPELVQGFVDGIVQGWQYTYSDPSAVIPLISSYDRNNLTPELIRFNLDKQKQSIVPAGAQYCDFSVGSWIALNQTLVDVKLLPAPVDLKAAVTMKFLDHRYGRSGAK